ncbi:MAG: hypothetical protein HPY45_10605 [Anaerolineae bacterium]|nr:hypothetical protein [Anaerolineae bacterium]
MTISSSFGDMVGVNVADGEGTGDIEAVEVMLATGVGVAVWGLMSVVCVVQALNTKLKQHKIKKALLVIIAV